MDSRDETEAVRPGSRHLYLLSQLVLSHLTVIVTDRVSSTTVSKASC